jgi:quercetin dioxygenase-like cupin family protein
MSKAPTLKKLVARLRLPDGRTPAATVVLEGPKNTGPKNAGHGRAAARLAAALGRPLERVDLTAVAGKYIGETEKNLAALFDRAAAADAVLFFDEADALFGRRSEVSSSNDRYANLETSYLLAQIERYRGIVILASNLRGNLDPGSTTRVVERLRLSATGKRRDEDSWPEDEKTAPAWEDAASFHRRQGPAYRGRLREAVFKRRRHMAHVHYDATHHNPDRKGARAGRGSNRSVWLFAEEGELAEGLFESPLELMIDTRLEPGAAIGEHRHADSEEIYYLLEGTLKITVLKADGRRASARLAPGDAHLVRRGQSHWAVAGADGARLIVVALRVGDGAGPA